MDSKVEVLNLEWEARSSRDRESATLVCNYLRYQGVSVFEGCIFQGYRLIDSLKPKILFITNSVGAKVNLNIIKYAKSKGIFCITSSSEGNFKEESVEQFFWGVNREKILYEDRVCLWNKDSMQMSVANYPEYKDRICVSGAIGFDRYRLIKPLPRNSRFTVAMACWNFDFLNSKLPNYGLFNGKKLSKEDMSFFEDDLLLFNKEITSVIKTNQHIDFIIKIHPGCLGGHYYSGVQGLDKYSNVKLVVRDMTITEILQKSDLLISYESTTALEAWLLNVDTVMLNPSGVEFPMREGFHFGQPCVSDAIELNRLIHEKITTGKIKGFEGLTRSRTDIIKNIIRWSDGLNHVRFGNEIINSLSEVDNISPSIYKNSGYFFKKIKQSFSWRFGDYLGLNSVLFKDIKKYWSSEVLNSLSEERMSQQIYFYEHVVKLTKEELKTLKVENSA
ncbi:hypothetical protein KW463_16285 [Vibrio fluvialis]|nr:hypothetical protein [Vibrio fluvialis]